MKVSVVNTSGDEVSSVELSPEVFEAKVNRGLMHQALVRQLANARQGTHKVKSRGEIALTGAKWYRQKGTGRARHGSRRAPIFVGGGVAHGPTPRSYAKDMPRKMRRGALRSALSVKAASNEIVVVDELAVADAKTKAVKSMLDNLTGGESTLLVLSASNEVLERSARNLANVKTLRSGYLNIRDLLGYEKIVMPVAAVQAIEAHLGSGDLSVAMDEEE